jgi:hypothetical protein
MTGSPCKSHGWRDHKPILLIFAMLIFCITLPPANAVELRALNVPSYSFDAPSGNVIYQIIVDQVPMGTNQTHTLTVGTATYYLNVETSNPYGIYYDFDISWTLPNGTTTTVHKSVTRLPGAGYKATIQPVYVQAESASFMVWTIDLGIGTSNSSISAGINTGPVGWSPSDALPFTSAAGDFGGVDTSVYLYTMLASDFTNHVTTYDPVWGLSSLGSTVFQWGWDGVLGFINQIPVIGPQFVTLITILAVIISEIIIWLVWILTNLPMVIAALEITIVMLSVAMAGAKPSIGKVCRNIFNYNVGAVKAFIGAFDLIFTWTREFIAMIAHVIGALKPL